MKKKKNCCLVERNKGAGDPRWTPSFPEMRALHNSQTGFRARRKLGQKLVPRSSSGAPCGQQQGRGGSAMRSKFKADFPPGISHALMASVVPMRISAGVRYIHMHAQTHDYPNACAKPWSRKNKQKWLSLGQSCVESFSLMSFLHAHMKENNLQLFGMQVWDTIYASSSQYLDRLSGTWSWGDAQICVWGCLFQE